MSYTDTDYPDLLDWAAVKDLLAPASPLEVRVKAGYHIEGYILGVTIGDPDLRPVVGLDAPLEITAERIDREEPITYTEATIQLETPHAVKGIGEVVLILRLLKTLKDVAPEAAAAILALIAKIRNR
jgi:hypothetical protein